LGTRTGKIKEKMMIYKILLISVLAFFTACGDDDKSLDTKGTNTPIATTEDSNKTERADKTVTIYIHGYSKDGYNKKGVYGEISEDEVIDSLSVFENFSSIHDYDENSTQILAVATYYGDQAPAYYSQEDIDDIENITKEYGGGIPRYATIIAKFAKYVLKETKADKLNIVSASMGSLVTRWLIEKDLENLATQKKIKKWLSIEGVIRGNYAASNEALMKIIDPIEKQHIDTKHMNYSWINSNLDGTSAKHINYKDIDMGFISSTHDKDGYLDSFLSLNGQLQPNDGVQLLKDTYFSSTPYNNPTYTEFYQDHLGIKDDKGAWAQVAAFLSSKKRVRITLTDAKIYDKHEHGLYSYKKYAEVVFQSRVKSPIAQTYGIDDDISERVVNGGSLNLIRYRDTDKTQHVDQIIFNGYVLEDEKSLHVEITGYELDKVLLYDVRELSLNSSKDSLGKVSLDIDLKNDTFEVSAKDWSGIIKVEVL
jgi:hypothetical protein